MGMSCASPVQQTKLRLRVGDWPVRFRTWRERDEAAVPSPAGAERRIIAILVVRHRNAAYRDL
jgi:hypothetical protein